MADKGTLYVVATPIGNLDDISKRAVEVLGSVSKIAAEDTRHSKKLMQAIGVTTPLLSYHEFSGKAVGSKIIAALQSGASVALISDAGTPLISDPGYKLVCRARALGLPIIPIPGACAVTAALSVAGLPTDKFAFEGFLPHRSAARRARLEALVAESRSLVFYESPHRIVESIGDMQQIFGSDRRIFVAREISKKFETHFLGTGQDCLTWLQQDSNQRKGEFVIIVAPCDELEVDARKLQQAVALVKSLRHEISMKRAVAIASEFTGARKNQLYSAILED
ncbi:MAG: 16S rRNA (cytidine(1402)-2'-O)-methyltransferase [Proteobacteria bacterium]|nr:16S rRNA (cytidine(1402)-2'-O)-methyltransferase [Pseudomonadota bacterium]